MSDPQSDWHDLNRTYLGAILPASVPQAPGFFVAGTTAFSEGVGGSTAWDAFQADDAVWISVLTVSGVGLPHAPHLALCRALIRDAASERSDPGEVLARVNRALVRAALAGPPQQVECSLIRLAEGKATWSSAGSVGALASRRGGTTELFAAQGPSMGVLEGFTHPGRALELQPGEHVLLLSEPAPGLLNGAADLVTQYGDQPVDKTLEILKLTLARALGEGRHDFSVVLVRAS
jgi:serine phosphatase RsbU (regulator of sigma subunit)